MASQSSNLNQRGPVITVASLNPVKAKATLSGLHQMITGIPCEVRTVSVPSVVADQPMSDEETLQGAINRAQNARKEHPDSHFWVGIEGGVEPHLDSYQSFAWVTVIDKNDRVGRARTAMFYQPQEVAKLIREGMELGHADDLVFGRENSKQHSGSVGLLTGDVIDRSAYYTQAVILTLIPFKIANLTF